MLVPDVSLPRPLSSAETIADDVVAAKVSASTVDTSLNGKF